jgi:aspartyl-tRNA(Asn)/glutamyl-tRNA(Gln) amidotransferase subunit B
MGPNIWQPVIGLEIHAQLKTKSKIFSPESAEYGSGDNENVGPVSLGLPGALPVLNKEVIQLASRAGLALNCQVQGTSQFARKNYFYPDMPKGYQITQYDKPICKNGWLEFFVDADLRKVRIERIHLEEDAGKSIHYGDHTLLNFNRAGVPLIEIVSQPDIRSPSEAAEYSRAIRQILRYINVCDGNLEEGSLRVDCNVSVHRPGEPLGTKVELKNLNSFRFIEKAVEYEIQRQIDRLESGQGIVQETRLYDAVKNMTFTMRLKEDAEDYRYFPDPDLLACEVSEAFLNDVRNQLPELPMTRVRRYVEQIQISREDALALTSEKELADYFESVARISNDWRSAANWVRTEYWGEIQNRNLSFGHKDAVSAEFLGELIEMINKGVITGKMAKAVFQKLWEGKASPKDIVRREGLSVVSDQLLIESIVKGVVEKNPDQVAQFRAGKSKVLGFFVGQIMKETNGQANPDIVNAILKKYLEE